MENGGQPATTNAFNFFVLQIGLLLVNIFKESLIKGFISFFESVSDEKLIIVLVLFLTFIYCYKLI